MSKRNRSKRAISGSPLPNSPWWDANSLRRHFNKHPGGKDKECWGDLLGKAPGTVRLEEYESSSLDVCRKPRVHYRAHELDVDHYFPKLDSAKPWHQQCDYYIDPRLVRTAVDAESRQVRTCFHEHFDRKHRPWREMSGALATFRYLEHLADLKKAGMVRGVEILSVQIPPGMESPVEEKLAALRSTNLVKQV